MTNRSIADYFQIKKRIENNVSASVGKIANNQPFSVNQNQITDRTNNYTNQADNVNNNPFNVTNTNNPFSNAGGLMGNSQFKPNLSGNGTNNPFSSGINNNDFAYKPASNNTFSAFVNTQNSNQTCNNTAVGNNSTLPNNSNNGANNFNNNPNSTNTNNFNSYLNANMNTNQNLKLGGLAAPPANSNPTNPFNANTNTTTNSFNNPFTINKPNNLVNVNNFNSNANTNSFNTPPVNSNTFSLNNNTNNNNNINNNLIGNNGNTNNNMLNNNYNTLNNANNFCSPNINSNANFNGNQINTMQANNSNPFQNTNCNLNNKTNLMGNSNQNNILNQIYPNNTNQNNNFNMNNNTNNGLVPQNQSNFNLAQFSFNKNNNQSNNILGNIPSNFNVQQQPQEINTIDLKASFNDFTKEDKEAFDFLNTFITKNGSVYSRVLTKTMIEENSSKKPTTLLHMASYYWKSCEPALIRYIDYKMKQGKPVNRKNFFIERKYQASKDKMNINNMTGFPNYGTNFNNNNNNTLIGNNGLNSNVNGLPLNSNIPFGNMSNNNINTNAFAANNGGNLNSNNMNSFTANQLQNNMNIGFNSNNGFVNNNLINANNAVPNNNPCSSNNNIVTGNSNLNGIQGINQMNNNNNFNTSFSNSNFISPLSNSNFNNNMMQNNNAFAYNNNQVPFGNNNLSNPMMNNNNLNNNNPNLIPQVLQNNSNNFFNNLIPNSLNVQNTNAPKDYDFFGGDNTNSNNNQNNIQNVNLNQGFNINNNNGFNSSNMQNALNNNTGFFNTSNLGGANFSYNQFTNSNLNPNGFNCGFKPQMQNNFNQFTNGQQNFNNNNNNSLSNNFIPGSTTNSNQGFNLGFNPNLSNNNSNQFIQPYNAYNSYPLNQNFQSEEAMKQLLLTLKIQELKKNPYGSFSSEADINQFLENFEKKDDEKLIENIKLKEKQRAEEQEKIKKDLYAKIDKVLEEDAYETLFAGNKKSKNEFISLVNPVSYNRPLTSSNSYLNKFPKTSIFENEKNAIECKDYAHRNQKASYNYNNNNKLNTTIINNNYNSYYNLSNNPFLYKNNNSQLLDIQNKLNNYSSINISASRPKIQTNNLSSYNSYNLNTKINYNNISRRGLSEKAYLENENNKNTSNRNFKINEFSSNYERLRRINTQSDNKVDHEEDIDFTNSIEYLKLTNDFLNLDDKKHREKTNNKYAASHFKNPFVIYKENSSSTSEADLSSVNQWKTSSNPNKKRELNAAGAYKHNKEALGPISEEKSELSGMISYEDIYLKKSEKKDDCDIKRLKFDYKDPLLNQTTKLEASVNINITGIELKKIIYDLLLKKNLINESFGLSYENVLINTNVGSITNDKQLKSNTYINENIALLVLISDPDQEENYIENPNKPENPILSMRKISDESSANNKNYNDNLDLSSINTKGETHSNFEYSETKNILRDVLRLENPDANNNYNHNNFNKNCNGNENEFEKENEERIENDLFNDYLIRKQLYKEAKPYFPKTMKYQTNPPLMELKNYGYQDLRKIENFAVFNQHGKITFKGLTDVTYLDLDKIIKINPMEIIVYDDFDFPKENEELNKPAVIEIFNYHIPINQDEKSNNSISDDVIEDHRTKVLECIKSQGGGLLEFSLEKNLLKFEVPYMRKSRD